MFKERILSDEESLILSWKDMSLLRRLWMIISVLFGLTFLYFSFMDLFGFTIPLRIQSATGDIIHVPTWATGMFAALIASGCFVCAFLARLTSISDFIEDSFESIFKKKT